MMKKTNFNLKGTVNLYHGSFFKNIFIRFFQTKARCHTNYRLVYSLSHLKPITAYNAKFQKESGYTLTEIMVTVLLLSIISVNQFKSAMIVQKNANNQLKGVYNLFERKQLARLKKLTKNQYQISADKQYPQLNALINQAAN